MTTPANRSLPSEPLEPRVLSCGCTVIGFGPKTRFALDEDGRPRTPCAAGGQLFAAAMRLTRFGADRSLLRAATESLAQHLADRHTNTAARPGWGARTSDTYGDHR